MHKTRSRVRKLLTLGALVPLGLGLGAVPAPAAPAAPSSFTHPGVLDSRAQLDFVRAKVNAGAQPWKSAYDTMLKSSYASLSRKAKPRSVVECGPYSKPNNGCTDEREDAIAAYTDALAWYVTRDDRYAKKSIELMDAWSAVLKSHTNSNAPLQTGWAGSSWPRAAEIIKYAHGSWADSGRFGTMLRNVYLNKIIGGSNSNGNWELSMMDASVGISVFLEDKTDFDKAVARYRNRVAAYIYLSSDGSVPKTVPGSGLDTKDKIVKYWQGQSTFTTGLAQETCRDFTHTGYGLEAISEVAETLRIQHQDVYGTDVGERLRQGLEFQAKYQNGAKVPSSLCKGKLNLGLGPTTEVGLDALSTRLGKSMPETLKYTQKSRPEGTNNLFAAWTTLTHAGNTA